MVPTPSSRPTCSGSRPPPSPSTTAPSWGARIPSSFEFTRTQSPTALWSVRYGLTYAAFIRDPLETFDLTGLGLPRYMKDQATFSVFPRFAPDGYSPIGTEGYLKMDRQEGVHHVSGSYSKILGGH